MRFLFIVQGEGRGHMTQAMALSDMILRNGHQLLEVLVGCSEMRQVPHFFSEQIHAPVRTFDSPNFLKTSDNKHFKIFRSILYNLRRRKRKAFFHSMTFITERIAETKPDVVINFYELLAGLAYRKYRISVPMVCIAHQFVFEHPENPLRLSGITHLLLRYYTKLSSLNADKCLALSFVPMNDVPSKKIFVVPPLLRQQVIDIHPTKQSYLLGYILNHGFAKEIIEWHSKNPHQVVHVFWDHPDMPDDYTPHANLTFHPLNDHTFPEMLSNCTAFFGTAGFESVCEALFLDKPILIVPAHAEQALNAKDAVKTGKVIAASSFDLDRLVQETNYQKLSNDDFSEWVKSSETKILSLIISNK